MSQMFIAMVLLAALSATGVPLQAQEKIKLRVSSATKTRVSQRGKIPRPKLLERGVARVGPLVGCCGLGS